MKARIVDNLLETIEQEMPHEGHRDNSDFLALRDRIQGQVVELRFIAGDAFEVQDNRFWLPNSFWEEIQ